MNQLLQRVALEFRLSSLSLALAASEERLRQIERSRGLGTHLPTFLAEVAGRYLQLDDLSRRYLRTWRELRQEGAFP